MRALGFRERGLRRPRLRPPGLAGLLPPATASPADQLDDFLQVIDKLERDGPEKQRGTLAPFGVTLDEVRGFCDDPANASRAPPGHRGRPAGPRARRLHRDRPLHRPRPRLLHRRGLRDLRRGQVDAGRRRRRPLRQSARHPLRRLGRPARHRLRDGRRTSSRNLIEETAAALRAATRPGCSASSTCDVYMVIADEARRPDALGLAEPSPRRRHPVDFPLTADQDQQAVQAGRRLPGAASRWWSATSSRNSSSRSSPPAPRSPFHPNADPSTLHPSSASSSLDGPLLA